MATKSKVRFSLAKTKRDIFKYWRDEQTARLVEYAKNEIVLIAEDINAYPSRNYMDRTGNLLDSLCWAVFYNKKKVENGFYREKKASEKSGLHEWSPEIYEDVDGHALAKRFLSSFKPQKSGWVIMFAVAAPYWGYWEEGFVDKWYGSFHQWAKMTEHYDKMVKELAPCKIEFHSYVPTY